MTNEISALIRELVAANRVLANEGLTDGAGHISVRHPHDPQRYFLSRSRSPEFVEHTDIMEFNLNNRPIYDDGRPLYSERPIHGAIYAARPDVISVVHNHCPAVLPFAITNTGMRPAIGTARRLGERVDVWDIREQFGDTDLLVTNNEQGASLARKLGAAKAVLMRGHGCAVTGVSVADAVTSALAMKKNATAILDAGLLGEPIVYLTPGEIAHEKSGAAERRGHDRIWEYLCRRAGVALVSGTAA